MDIVTPITGEVVATVQEVDRSEVASAFARARRAQEKWRRTSPSDRGAVLRRCVARLHETADELADLETLNTGKPLVDTRREARRAAGSFEYYAGWADKVRGTTLPLGAAHAATVPEPVGTVVGIVPWNVPYFFAAKKIAPAIAFGNACILKPAQETPLTALRLAEILHECGLPEGLAQVLPGGGDLGAALVEAGDADMIVFTGSDQTGVKVARAAAATLTPTVMELGGKSPQLVFADADLDAALEGVLLGVFGAAGQMCIAGSRLYLEESIAPRFIEALRVRVRSLHVGDPREDGVHVGPLITAPQRDKVLELIEAGEREGGTRLAQASVPDVGSLAQGFFAPPTVFCDVDPGMRIMREEVFGPVLAVATFADEADALHKAHETDFGLAAGIWTSDIGRAHRLARELDVGTVWINTYRVLNDLVPFGGTGRSGYGRENGAEAARIYTRCRSMVTGLEQPIQLGAG